MLPLLLLLLTAHDPDVRALGDDRWEEREAAQHRLELAGPSAWPALLLARDDDAEVRRRARDVLAPLRGRVPDGRRVLVLWLIYGPVTWDDPDRTWGWETGDVQDDVLAEALAAGLYEPGEYRNFYTPPLWRGPYFAGELAKIRARAGSAAWPGNP